MPVRTARAARAERVRLEAEEAELLAWAESAMANATAGPAAEQAALRAPDEWEPLVDDCIEPEGESRVPELFKAGFWDRERGVGWGFGSGGVADGLVPGPVLATLADDAWQAGLGRLNDDELIGVLRASRRLASRAAAMELAAVGELVARRFAEEEAGETGVVEHINDEVAAALTLTGRAADKVVNLALDLSRLPATAAALAAGEIDVARAWVVADETSALGAAHRSLVEQKVLGRAGGQTTTELRRCLRRAVLAADPAAAKARKERAQREARVERWDEPAGTAALAGRDLPPAGVLAADRNLTGWASQLKAGGAKGTMDQLRAAVYLALLSGQPIEALMPAADGPAGQDSEGNHDGATHRNPARDSHGGCDQGFAGMPSTAGSPLPAGLTQSADGLGRGSVNLTMPLSTWLGLSEAPGDVAGYGHIDAADSRSLAALVACRAEAQWCLTLTDANGHPAAHGCARPHKTRRTRAGPGGDDRAWTFTVSFLQAGDCAHPRESSSYQPPPHLRHLVQVRNATCTFPGCRRAAIHCDVDHTLAYQQGGRTCECNLGPVCRHHHKAKQTRGWQLTQNQPGGFTWTTPSGRTYTTCPTNYES
ncbi:MAG TPA: HNH endonuclease signature motif containing protein [Streptosporangiaceae bacterium]|nr:HNH endonuclease signature motif containing protein [Streptosporangiaceae bacterium]